MPTELLGIIVHMGRVEFCRFMLMRAEIILQFLKAYTSNTEKIAKLFC